MEPDLADVFEQGQNMLWRTYLRVRRWMLPSLYDSALAEGEDDSK